MMRNLRLLRIPAAAAALGAAVFAAVALVATPAATGADDGLLRINLLWTNDVHGHIAPEPAKFMNPDWAVIFWSARRLCATWRDGLSAPSTLPGTSPRKR